MTIEEAEKILNELTGKLHPSKEEEFLIEEANRFLFEKTGDSSRILQIGSRHYEEKNFDLARKYYEMASDLGNRVADLCLGYVWYYGRTGTRDYKKAFDCFEKVAKEEKPSMVWDGKHATSDDVREAKMKIADMYKNGYYVGKSEDKYEEIIEELYKAIPKNQSFNVFEKIPEIFLRKARILEKQGDISTALHLYSECKNIFSIRLKYNQFFGDINQMNWTVNDIYRLLEFDPISFDFYDLFYLLKEEKTVTFSYKKSLHTIRFKKEGEEMSVSLDGIWYRKLEDLIRKAEIDKEPITKIADRLEDFRIIENEKPE